MPNMINLNSIAGGGLAERVQIELNRLATNISDPNTKAKAPRELTISIKITPDDSREIALSEINVTSKLAPLNGIPTKFIIDQDIDGESIMTELKSGSKNQLMFDEDMDVADDKGNKLVDNESGNKVVRFK